MAPQQALGDTTAFLAATDALHVILAGMTNFTGAMPAGVPVMIAWGTRDRLLFPRPGQSGQGSAARGTARAAAWLRPRAHDRRPSAGRRRPAAGERPGLAAPSRA
jgi:hypothetical protein